jgi:hypothetical protein
VGHRSGARLASKHAKYWAIGAILTGVAIAAVIIIINIVYYVNNGTSAEHSTSSNSF